MSTLAALAVTLRDAARDAGTLLVDLYARPDLLIDYKGAADLVTSADRAAESLIVSRIRAAYPAHRILAEESGLHAGEEPASWYVDPIDGTLNFANQIPFWSTSVAVDAGPVGRAGVVYAPLLKEFFAATSSEGASLNGYPIAARQLDPEAAIVYTHIAHGPRRLAESVAISAYLAPRVRRLRMIGSIALALAYVAAGRMDGVLQVGASAWDFMAGVLLVEETGGVTADPDGGPLRPESRGVAAAATPALLQLLLESVAQSRQAGS
jgi:myo-inositol-1(or 4)-monophosphatase